jgi:hypothetical protein
VYETILSKSGAKLRQATSSNEFISVRQRFTDNGSAILFVGNYYNEGHTGKIAYTHPQNGEAITIPYLNYEILWPALYSVLSPVCLEVHEGIKILHSTSDILGVESNEGQLNITLFGNRDLAGEIVFEGSNVDLIKSAKIDGSPVKINFNHSRIVILYSHNHQKEICLTVNFS